VTLSKPRGFATVAWAEDGLAFVAVSDVDPPELTRFAELVRAPSS
jgi:anti-sigma factor RsiW